MAKRDMAQMLYEQAASEDAARANGEFLPSTLKGLGLVVVVGFIGICLDVAVVTVQGWYHAFMAYWPF